MAYNSKLTGAQVEEILSRGGVILDQHAIEQEGHISQDLFEKLQGILETQTLTTGVYPIFLAGNIFYGPVVSLMYQQSEPGISETGLKLSFFDSSNISVFSLLINPETLEASFISEGFVRFNTNPDYNLTTNPMGITLIKKQLIGDIDSLFLDKISFFASGSNTLDSAYEQVNGLYQYIVNDMIKVNVVKILRLIGDLTPSVGSYALFGIEQNYPSSGPYIGYSVTAHSSFSYGIFPLIFIYVPTFPEIKVIVSIDNFTYSGLYNINKDSDAQTIAENIRVTMLSPYHHPQYTESNLNGPSA